jgi:hypothetical protein
MSVIYFNARWSACPSATLKRWNAVPLAPLVDQFLHSTIELKENLPGQLHILSRDLRTREI